jgi:phosphate-selective porin OprO/OprP
MFLKYRLLGCLTVGGIFLLLLRGSPVQAQDGKVLEELRARLERLEQENAALQKRLQELEQKKGETPAGPAASSPAVTEQEVRKLVEEALREEANKKTAPESADRGKTAEKEGQKSSGGAGEFYQVGSDPNLRALYKDGRFWIESPHKDFGSWIGGYVQQDWVWNGVPGRLANDFRVPNGANPFQDQAFPRRARIDMFGYAWEQVEWGVELDLENNPLNTPAADLTAPLPAGQNFPVTGNAPAVAFTDLWAGVKDIPFLGTIRVGHIRDPIGLENYSSSMALSFLERGSNFDAFYQEFQTGVQGFNSWFDQRLNLAWSVARTDPGFLQYDTNVGNGNYAITSRIAGLPIWLNGGRCLLHLGAAYQYRTGEFDPVILDHDVRYRARPPFRESFLLPRFVDTGILVADRNDIVGLEGLLVWGPLHVQSEFTEVFVNNAASGGKAVGDLNFQAFYVYVGYFLTGESRAYDKRMLRLGAVQQPIEPFFWVRGGDGRHHWGWGAWEILFRYDVINLNSGPIRGGSMEDYTIALNWYLNPQLKFQLDYVLADREVDRPKQSGLAQFFGARFQLNF